MSYPYQKSEGLPARLYRQLQGSTWVRTEHLALRLGVSYNTAHKALKRLQERGLLESRQAGNQPEWRAVE